MAEKNNSQAPTRGPAHEQLGVFAGRWTARGQLAAPPGEALTVTEEVEWLPGRFFLLQREVMRFGAQSFETTKVLGYDASQGACFIQHFDNQGYHRTYRLDIRDGVWTLSGEHERATYTFGPDARSFTARWEQRAPGSPAWTPLCEFRAVRQ